MSISSLRISEIFKRLKLVSNNINWDFIKNTISKTSTTSKHFQKH